MGYTGAGTLSVLFTGVFYSPDTWLFLNKYLWKGQTNEWCVERAVTEEWNTLCHGRVRNAIAIQASYDWRMSRNSDGGGQAVEKGAKRKQGDERKVQDNKLCERCLNEKEGRALLSIERATWLILKWFHYCLTVKGTVTSRITPPKMCAFCDMIPRTWEHLTVHDRGIKVADGIHVVNQLTLKQRDRSLWLHLVVLMKSLTLEPSCLC